MDESWIGDVRDTRRRWVIINDTVVPVVQRSADGRRPVDMVPLPLIRFGARLSGDRIPESFRITATERGHLAEMCLAAGIAFVFPPDTELVRLGDVLEQYADEVRFSVLPTDVSFFDVGQAADDGPSTSAGGRQSNERHQSPSCNRREPRAGQLLDLSARRTNAPHADVALEDRVAEINERRRRPSHVTRHKASLRTVRDESVLCLDREGVHYVPLSNIYAAFFARLSFDAFAEANDRVDVPTVDLPTGYGNICERLPERMVALVDAGVYVDRVRAAVDAMAEARRRSRDGVRAKDAVGRSPAELGKNADPAAVERSEEEADGMGGSDVTCRGAVASTVRSAQSADRLPVDPDQEGASGVAPTSGLPNGEKGEFQDKRKRLLERISQIRTKKSKTSFVT